MFVALNKEAAFGIEITGDFVYMVLFLLSWKRRKAMGRKRQRFKKRRKQGPCPLPTEHIPPLDFMALCRFLS